MLIAWHSSECHSCNHRPSDLTVSDRPESVTDVAIRAVTHRLLVGMSSENEKPLQPLPKSSSVPVLPHEIEVASLHPLRSRSDYDLKHTLHVSKSRSSAPSSETTSLRPKRIVGLISTSELYDVPILHVQEPTDIETGQISAPYPTKVESEHCSAHLASLSDNDTHLQNMDISQQLRCMSQLSDVAKDELYVASPHPWNFYRRERSGFGPSGRSRHSRQESSIGVDSTSVPSAWGRVRTPSSIYSRPTSPAKGPTDMPYMAMPDLKDTDSPVDYNSLFANWPLKPSQSSEEVHRKLSTVSQNSAASEHRNKPLPPTPDESWKQSSTASFVTAANNNDGSSIKWLSPRQTAFSIESKDSSSNLTKASKARNFLERFSPSKYHMKFVQKRRSTFRFLRPGSRRQQGRSVSTPMLSAKPSGRPDVDGPSDDPALLTVQYELDNEPKNPIRSRSMSYLTQLEPQQIGNQPLSPTLPQRRPSMAVYERTWSVVGDDRRRPSVAVNHQRMQEIQVEDKNESIGLRRRLSRAHALKDDASPLMAQALEKHQQEKALFRSASKARESLKSSRPATLSSTGLVGQEDSDLQANSIIEEDEGLDPLAVSPARQSTRRSVSFTCLLPPRPQTATSSLRISTIDRKKASPIIQGQVKGKQSIQAPTSKPRIGTSLDSWSRYPSHTRSERCGSAGKADAVITRDFAIDINLEEIQSADEAEPVSPTSKRSDKFSYKSIHPSLLKSRSMTFSTLSSIKRYYSNIFGSSGTTAQNRRTSVSTGGHLDYPELEMLPPPSTEATTHHRHSYWDPFERLKEDAYIIKDYIKGEEDKFGGYVRKEEDKLETFVHKEEDKIEGFVKKQEHQFEDFVKKEEQKLKTYVQEEEVKLHRPHQHRHYSGYQSSQRRSSPFQEVDVFGVSRTHNQDQLARKESMIGPAEDADNTVSPAPSTEKPDAGLTLDGAHSTPTKTTSKAPSKAGLWSDMYKECILQTPAQVGRVDDGGEADSAATTIPPPPPLKPVKPRSLEQPMPMDARATIRRFPSVTVIDDCKGHYRSISLISVKTGKSANFECTSTVDLLELLQAREREEREKLLKGVTVTTAVKAVGDD